MALTWRQMTPEQRNQAEREACRLRAAGDSRGQIRAKLLKRGWDLKEDWIGRKTQRQARSRGSRTASASQTATVNIPDADIAAVSLDGIHLATAADPSMTYVADPSTADDPAARALAALDAVAAIGDDDEREATLAELMEALAATRRAEGRPF